MADLEIDYPFAGGVDEKTQSQLVEPGSALTVSNLRQLKNGSYQKRLGYTAIPSVYLDGSALPAGKRIMGHNDALLQTDGTYLYSRSPTANAWIRAGGLTPQVLVTETSVMALPYRVQGYDCVELNGYRVVAACMPNDESATPTYSIFATVLDAASGTTVIPDTIVAFGPADAYGTKFRLATVGDQVVLLYALADGIYYARLFTGTNADLDLGWSTAGRLINDTVGAYNSPFDACTIGNTLAVAYYNNSVFNTISVRTFSTSFTPLALALLTAGNTPSCVSICGAAGDVVFVAYPYNGGKELRVEGLDPVTLASTATEAALAVVDGTTTKRVAVARTGTGAGVAVFTDGAGGSMYTRAFGVGGGAVTPTGSNVLKNFRMNLDSRPFVANGRIYCTARTYTASPHPGENPYRSSNDLLLLDLTQSMADRYSATSNGYLRVAASISPRLAFPVSGYSQSNADPRQQPVNVISVSATEIAVPVAVLQTASSSCMQVATLKWSVGVSQPSVLNQNLALSGGSPSFYDGERCSEIGFVERPVIVGIGISNPPGLSPTVGYRYVVVYEHIDGNGQWHQGNVSDPSPLVKPTNAGVDVDVSTLQCTNRADITAANNTGPSKVRLALYRTKDGGSTFYRVANDIAGVHGTLIDDPQYAFMAFATDTLDNDQLGAPLYTQPGIPGVAQPRVNPPSLYPLIAHGDRLVGAHGKDIWFSGQSVSGEGYWFADLFQFTVESGGDITALASLDGALVIFKRDKIAFVDGSGPPDNGAGGDFSPPQFIAADVGCIDHRSVVVTPAGVMFQSLRGIELLSRGRSLASYFGSNVEATLKANPVITSAVLDEAKGVVIFSALPTETSLTGVTLVWDYVHMLWTTTNLPTQSAIMWGNSTGTVPVRTFLAGGNVFQESASTYLDAGTFVSSTIVTPWIKMSGLQGYGRTKGIALLMSQATACDITVSVEVDYREGVVVQTRTFTATEISALRIPQVYMTMKTQKVEAFRLTIAESTPTGGPVVGTGQGATFIGLRIEYAQKSGINRAPATAG